MRRILIGTMVLATAWSASAQEKTLSGAQIAQAFAGRTISGVENGERYTERLLANGDIAGIAADGPYEGEWEVDGDEICFTYEDAAEDCSRVRLSGSTVTFLGDGGGRFELGHLSGAD